MESSASVIRYPPHTASGRPVLLLLPGMICNYRLWSAQIAALSDIVEPVVVEYGSACSLADMAGQILETAPGSFFLAGHSMGARVAMEVARRTPERIRGLCLIGTEHRAAPVGEQGQQESAARMHLLEIARHDGMRKMAEAWLPQLVFKKNHGIAETIILMLAESTPEQLAAHIQAGAGRTDASMQLSRLRIPVLLIAGADDAIRPPQQHHDIIPLLHDGELTIIPKCGHMPPLEIPDAVNTAMRTWLVRSLTASPPFMFQHQPMRIRGGGHEPVNSNRHA